MDEDGGVDVEPSSSPRAPQPKLKSAITSAAPKKTKGRGFREEADAERHSRLADRNFESLGSDGGPGPQRSIEGWIILATGVHEEAQEDDLQNAFGEFGEIRNLHLNLDRRTGFVKGYALIEYENYEEAQNAITAMNGTELLTHTINVDWAFSNGPSTGPFKRKNMRKSPMKRQVPGEGTYGVVYKAIDDTKEDMKTTAFWDWFLIVIGSVFFLGFLFTAVISKLLPVSDNLILSAIQNDRYYCFLVPLTLPIAVVSVYFHWLSMKLFKHA